MKLLIDNLPPSVGESDLCGLFSGIGTISKVTIGEGQAVTDNWGMLELNGSRLSTSEVIERVGRVVWRNRRLDVHESTGAGSLCGPFRCPFG
jgi:hypothetical protein